MLSCLRMVAVVVCSLFLVVVVMMSWCVVVVMVVAWWCLVSIARDWLDLLRGVRRARSPIPSRARFSARARAARTLLQEGRKEETLMIVLYHSFCHCHLPACLPAGGQRCCLPCRQRQRLQAGARMYDVCVMMMMYVCNVCVCDVCMYVCVCTLYLPCLPAPLCLLILSACSTTCMCVRLDRGGMRHNGIDGRGRWHSG